MPKTIYSLSFTAGALLYNEFSVLQPILEKENCLELLEQEILNNHFMAIKTQAARERIITEIKKRLRSVDLTFWDFYNTIPVVEQKLALFYLILKTYPLLFDLHFEVVLKRWKAWRTHLEIYDLQMRLDELSSADEELANMSASTKTKALTVFIRMLREAGLMKSDTLQKVKEIDSAFWSYFIQKGDIWFLDASLLSKQEREKYL